MQTVQDLMIKDLIEEDTDRDPNEILELLEFMKHNATPLTNEQVKGFYLLSQFEELQDLPLLLMNMKSYVTSEKKYFKLIDKLTLADRIKGNAKLSNLLKANMSNPSQTVNPKDFQPKSLRSDI